MSEYAATRDPDPNLDPNLQVGREVLPPDPGPLVQVCDLHGGYVLALLSQEQDPEGHNMALRCKVRTILSQDRTGLGAQVATVLVAEFGLTPEEAEALIPPDLVTPEMEEARKQRELVKRGDAPAHGFAPETLGTPGFGWQEPQPEHERSRDAATGRYVSQETTWTEPAREA